MDELRRRIPFRTTSDVEDELDHVLDEQGPTLVF